MSGLDIIAKRNTQSDEVNMWRTKFMAQIRDLNLDLLANWIEWKRYCRFRQIKKEQKELEKLKKQTQNKLKIPSARSI